MLYLDYSATTPVDKELLDLYIDTCNSYIGNVNSLHELGKEARMKLQKSTLDIARQFDCCSGEIIFTSGASESNMMAILGTVRALKHRGKHIITSKLEHKSILDLMKYLETIGYKIDYVEILSNGLINLRNLEEKIRDDTILVSICGVNAEIGYIQPLGKIREIIDKQNHKIFFHSDLTQALGKIKIDLSFLDLASFSSHKIYAPIGCGILYKEKTIHIEKFIYGTTATCPYRGGTPPLPLIVTFSKAIEIANTDMALNNEKCIKLRNKLITGLEKYPIKINSNDRCIPEIVNFSLLSISNKLFVSELSKIGIYVSTGSACCSNKKESEVLMELTNKKEIYETSVRVSLSHKTTDYDIDTFLEKFDIIWNKYYVSKGGKR